MKGDRIPHGLHPDWCDLGHECANPTTDPRHVGMVSSSYPYYDDVRIDVELIRQDDHAPAATLEGGKQICLRLTNAAACDINGRPSVADTYLSHGDAMALAHTLTTYAKRLERRDGNYPPDVLQPSAANSEAKQ